MSMLWTPPAPGSYRAARPPLWSARRTALAIVAAVVVAAMTVVGVSYADTGPASPSNGPGGGFSRFGGPGAPGGRFGGGFPTGMPGGGFPTGMPGGGQAGGLP